MVRLYFCQESGKRFVKHLRRTSKLNHYGLWHGRDSAPRKRPNSGLVEEHKKDVTIASLCFVHRSQDLHALTAGLNVHIDD